jgi:hypothetical protein
MSNQGCTAVRRINTPKVALHREHCQAWCTKCYYSISPHRYFNIISNYNYGRHCRCEDWWRRFCGEQPNNSRLVCMNCDKLDDTSLQALRGKRDRHMYRGHVQQLLSCANCAKAVPPRGPLWWICSHCGFECGSHEHPEWGPKFEAYREGV